MLVYFHGCPVAKFGSFYFTLWEDEDHQSTYFDNIETPKFFFGVTMVWKLTPKIYLLKIR